MGNLALLQSMVTVNESWIDYFIIAVYFVFVLGIGAVLRTKMQTSEDYFLSGRSLPSWITGLAFLGANLGALEIMGMGAGAATYGIMQAHYYWIGAIPAMVFVALFMIPFYYASRVHSVPGFLRLRYNEATRGFNSILFAIFMILLSGINMFAMALVFQLLLGWSLTASIFLSAAIVLAYVTLGGLSSSIYNEVLQFFLITLGLVPLVIFGLIDVGGLAGLKESIGDPQFFHAGPTQARRTTLLRCSGSTSCSGSVWCRASATGARTSSWCRGLWRPRIWRHPREPLSSRRSRSSCTGYSRSSPD